MNLNDVIAKVKKRPTRKRCGRGPGSGLGKTSGRGHKGAASRAGWKRRYGYDGGQTSLIRRLPKRGFSNHPFRTRFDVVNLTDIETYFSVGETVNLEALVARGIVCATHGRLKVLGTGELKKKLSIVAYAASAAVLEKVAAAGGKVELLGPPKKKRKPVPPKPQASSSAEPAAKKSKKNADADSQEGSAE